MALVPSPWAFALLALASFRVVRLLAWDTFPLAQRLRDRLLGAQVAGGHLTYRRPLLADLFGCPFCLGFWVALAAYAAWVAAPTAALAASAVFALAAAVGLVAKNLDP